MWVDPRDPAEQMLVVMRGSIVPAIASRLAVVTPPSVAVVALQGAAYMFCLLLPFGLASSAGPWTPLVMLIVSYTVFGLDALGDELESPFGTGQPPCPSPP